MTITLTRALTAAALAAALLAPAALPAQDPPDPSSSTNAAADTLEELLRNVVTFFTGPIAMTICIVAVVIAGVAYATTDGNKKQIFTVILGVCIALFAAQVISYLWTSTGASNDAAIQNLIKVPR